jgi:pimeloyl-ACP methyl ester carboxylesterase
MTTMPEPASRTLDVNGLRVHYLDWGNLGAPPILCVHGYTSSAQAFNALARRLRDRHHVVAPDVRGHGESGWSPSGAYQYENQVGDGSARAAADQRHRSRRRGGQPADHADGRQPAR